MFATPLFVGFANEIMPLQIGAADVAFPRMNMLSYWLYLLGGIMAIAGFFTPGGAPSFGWTAYAPLSSAEYSPGIGSDLWIVGLAIGGLGTILGGVNFITTIFCMRAPGMTMFRMSIFTWNVLLTSILILLAFPPLAAALLGLMLLAAGAIAQSPGVQGGESGSMLDTLFAKLQTATDPVAVQELEQAIWQQWTLPPDPGQRQLMLRGISEMQQQELSSAAATFTRLIDLAPQLSEAWNKRATVHWLMGNFKASISDRKSTRLNSSHMSESRMPSSA